MNCATCKYRYKDPVDGNICTCNPVPVAEPKIGYTLKFQTCQEKNYGEQCYDYSDGLDIIVVYLGQTLAIFCTVVAFFSIGNGMLMFLVSLFGIAVGFWLLKQASKF